jgi:hypothetical protein
MQACVPLLRYVMMFEGFKESCKSTHWCLSDGGARRNRVSTLSLARIRSYLQRLVNSGSQDQFRSYTLCLVNAGSHVQRATLVHITRGVSNNGTISMQPSIVTTRICRALIEVESRLIRRTYLVKSAISKFADTIERGHACHSGQLTNIEGSRQFAQKVSV